MEEDDFHPRYSVSLVIKLVHASRGMLFEILEYKKPDGKWGKGNNNKKSQDLKFNSENIYIRGFYENEVDEDDKPARLSKIESVLDKI